MNALMRLNQVHPGLQYKLLGQSGPVHAPVFSMSVELQGTVYEASGASKKMAKLQVALKVAARLWEGNVEGAPAGGLRLLTSLYTAALDGPNDFCSSSPSSSSPSPQVLQALGYPGGLDGDLDSLSEIGRAHV